VTVIREVCVGVGVGRGGWVAHTKFIWNGRKEDPLIHKAIQEYYL